MVPGMRRNELIGAAIAVAVLTGVAVAAAPVVATVGTKTVTPAAAPTYPNVDPGAGALADRVAYEQAAQAARDAEAARVAAEQAAAAEAARVAAEQAAQQQAAAASRQAATQRSVAAGDGKLPAGAVVPSIPGTTSPDTTACASASASNNAQGVPVCD